MTEHDPNADHSLVEDLLDDVRFGQTPAPSADLMARILADAAQVQPVSFWRDMFAGIGGWRGIGGLTTAGVTGLWLGVAPTSGVDSLISTVWGEPVAVSLMADLDSLDVGS